MKLTFFEVEDWQKKYLREKLKGHEIKFFDDELSMKNVSKIKDVEGIGVFIYSQVDRKVIDSLPKLRFIVTMSTGFNHIDVEYAKSKNISVANVPRYGENTVAEHAIGLMLCLSKKLPRAVSRTKKGNFDLDDLEGFDLKDKTLGVIGCGNIGENVVRIARAIGMKVLVNSRTCDSKLSKKYSFQYVSLNELLKKSDIVTLHVPLTSNTQHMINMKNVKIMKKGSYIVNTARGGLIETKALVYGLNKDIIAGAALDVLEGEDDLKDDRHLSKRKYSKEEKKLFKQNHMLLKDKDVIITPHSAFFTREALIRILDRTVENVNSHGKMNSVN